MAWQRHRANPEVGGGWVFVTTTILAFVNAFARGELQSHFGQKTMKRGRFFLHSLTEMTFGDRFVAEGLKPFEHEGKLVHPWASIAISPSTRLRITVMSFKSRPRQLVALAAFGCKLKFIKEEYKAVDIPADSEPNCYFVDFSKVKEGAFCRIGNAWMDSRGKVQVGLGNAGVWIEQLASTEGEDLVLHCSDGSGKPDFSSLVVRCEVLEGSKPTPEQ